MIALARAVPQATIVMCHVGGVLGYGAYGGRKDEILATWRASMAELADCPNVSVKLGGMLNRGAALDFRELPAPPNSTAWAAAWRPYVETCIELFGAEPLQFREQFPGRQDGHRLRDDVERVQAHHRRRAHRPRSSPSIAAPRGMCTSSIDAGSTRQVYILAS